jgi:hypothetical protein
LWTGTTPGGPSSSPAVSGGVVYLAGGSVLSAFDPAGQMGCAGVPKVCAAEWTAPLGAGTPSSPAVSGGRVFVTAGATLSAFDATGATGCSGTPVVCTAQWSAAIGNTAGTSSPAVADGVLFVGSDDGNVYAFDPEGLDNCTASPRACRPLWSGTTGGAVTSSPAVQSGRVYVGSHDAQLYQFAACNNPKSSTGLAPCDLTSAYRLPTLAGSPTKTVAVVDAFGDPTVESDLAVYRAMYHLPPCTTANGCFTKVNQRGLQSGYPAANSGWALETALDVEMVSAICPLCHIVLGESDDDSFENLAATQDTVAALHPVAISDSFGGTEFSGQGHFDADFVHSGILTVAATGDDGYPGGTEYPSVLPSVTAVGGTTLSFTGSGRGWSETVWNANPGSASPTAGGSGCSTFETKPTWQHDVGCVGRTTADVSAVASHVAVYVTTGYGGWVTVQGTSAASPLVAALYAIGGSGAGVSNLYTSSPQGFYDVINGNNGPACGSAYLCDGMFGYDGPTGLGTPCGLAAWGGTSPVGCGVTASPSGGVAQRAAGNQPGAETSGVVPACGDPEPGHARCFAWRST